ncbi:MAG: NUDIX domain-containing protein [Chitinophagales bacterium]
MRTTIEQIIKVRLILRKNSKILILEKSKIEGGGFSLIGGRVKNTESATKALVRETKEEADIKVYADKLKLVHVAHRLKAGQPVITLFFETDEWEGKIKNLEPKLHKDFEWVSLKSIPKAMTDYIKNALNCYQEGITYSEFNWKPNNKVLPKKVLKEK